MGPGAVICLSQIVLGAALCAAPIHGGTALRRSLRILGALTVLGGAAALILILSGTARWGERWS